MRTATAIPCDVLIGEINLIVFRDNKERLSWDAFRRLRANSMKTRTWFGNVWSEVTLQVARIDFLLKFFRNGTILKHFHSFVYVMVFRLSICLHMWYQRYWKSSSWETAHFCRFKLWRQSVKISNVMTHDNCTVFSPMKNSTLVIVLQTIPSQKNLFIIATDSTPIE